MQTKTFICIIVSIVAIIVVNTQKVQKQEQILVSTSLGLVKGSLMKTRLGKNIQAFRGIPYAEPPIGDRRFKDPVRVKPWQGTFDASKEGPACIQSHGVNLSEDCLTLNIYTKQENARKLPVIVFIHPGGYIDGSSQSFIYGPQYLLDHDVVLVTINYRLSSLGFINTGDAHSSGNYGFKDQVLALEFVRDNIAAFGGDPNSVTLTGQSSGSRSVTLHLVSPMSKGLFHRAIAVSGTAITPIPPQREQLGLALKQARLLNCTTETLDKMFRCLRETPAEDFGKTDSSFEIWYGDPILVWYPAIQPIVPGTSNFLNHNPETLLINGKINSVPLIIGYTKDEYAYHALKGIKEALHGDNTYFKQLNEYWFELAPICFGYERDTARSRYISQKLHEHYFGNENITLNNSDSLEKLFAQAIAQYPIYRTARLIAKASSDPIYFYKFTYQGRFSASTWEDSNKPAVGVRHGDDLQYIFNIHNDIYNNVKYPTLTEDDPEIVMVKRLTSMWAHFATTNEPLPENPELFGNVTWSGFTTEKGNYLNIGKRMIMKKDIFSPMNRFWDNLFPNKFGF